MDRQMIFLAKTFGEEGGFQDDPNDKGNYYHGKLYGTIWGITAANHFSTFQKCYTLYEAGKIEESKKVAVLFYRVAGYWNPLYDIIMDVSLAFRIWDFGVNAGVVTSVKYVQQTIYKYYYPKIKVDGIFGTHTVTNLNRFSNKMVRKHLKQSEIIPGETEFYTLYIRRLEKHYRSLKNFWRFGSGWLKRVRRVFNGLPDLYQPLDLDPRGFDYVKR